MLLLTLPSDIARMALVRGGVRVRALMGVLPPLPYSRACRASPRLYPSDLGHDG
jgi:hypothetical protein